MSGATAIDYLKEFRDCLVREDNKDLRSRCESDLSEFCREFTPWEQMSFHKKWVRHMHKHRRALVLAPRDHGKSQQLTIAYSTQKILADRDLRVLIVSDTDAMATRFMRDIKSILLSDRVKEVWGDVKGEKWDSTEIILKGRSYWQKEATVTALSVGGAITSGHYDIIILDDVVDFENSRSQLQRDKIWEWFKFTLLPVVSPEASLWIIGTRYHFDDFYGRLQDPKQYPAAMAIMISKAIGDDGKALWPERYSLKVLESRRLEMGSLIFNSQYQNDIEAMKGTFFKAPWVKRYLILPSDLRLFQFMDLAISEKQSADYTAHVTVGVSVKKMELYVLSAIRGRWSFSEQETKLHEQHDLWHRGSRPVNRIGVEANAYQASLAKEAKRNSLLPIKAVHVHKDKVTRAGRLQALMENGKVFFPMQGTEDLELELLTFPEGQHDDLVDALTGAAELAGVGTRRPARVQGMPSGF